MNTNESVLICGFILAAVFLPPPARAAEFPPPPAQAEARSNSEFPAWEFLGFNYVDWTAGTFPFSTAWRPATAGNAQAIKKADIISFPRPPRSRGSLALTVDARSGSDTCSQGEVSLDLRYPTDYSARQGYALQTTSGLTPLGVNLLGKVFGAIVYCPRSFAHGAGTPNGVQLFAKSVTIVDGQEVWGTCSSAWHNIVRSAWRYKDPLPPLVAGRWNLVSMSLVAPPQPSTFDPASVAAVGIRFVLGTEAQAGAAGTMLVDNLGWLDVQSDDPLVSSGGGLQGAAIGTGVRLWSSLTAKTAPIRYRGRSGQYYTATASGAKVLYLFEDIVDPIRSMAANGFNTGEIVPTEYMPAPNAVVIQPDPLKTHSAEEIVATIKAMKAARLKVILKPHVDVADGSWRGQIRPVDTAAWFAAYSAFIVRYAALAQAQHADLFVIGTEFSSLGGWDNRAAWEQVVAGIRQVYSGKLTYAANWDASGTDQTCLWDLVDVIGLDAYFPLSGLQAPALADLVAGWNGANPQSRDWASEIAALQQATGKDILFTECGYRSTDYPARAPSEYVETRPVNLDAQANCYKAVARVFKGVPWFRGCLFWNRLPLKDYGGAFNGDFSSQHKPADECFKPAFRMKSALTGP
ncbi:MAG: hypothetical protein ABSE73_25050 [Planctomycetota bacterium]